MTLLRLKLAKNKCTLPPPKKVITFTKYKPFENWNPDRKATKTGLLYTDAYEQNRLLVDKSTSNFYK